MNFMNLYILPGMHFRYSNSAAMEIAGRLGHILKRKKVVHSLSRPIHNSYEIVSFPPIFRHF